MVNELGQTLLGRRFLYSLMISASRRPAGLMASAMAQVLWPVQHKAILSRHDQMAASGRQGECRGLVARRV